MHDPTPSAQPLTPGQTFAGRYLVDAFLGQGGFAQVWRATHVELGAPVALKILSPPEHFEDLDPAAIQAAFDRVLARFRREAKTISLLRSPYTVSALDFGQHEGTPFMALEYVDGRNLDAVLAQDGPLPPDRALPIARQILESLAEAHALGVLHRDIKPDNVMLYEHLGRADRVKVLDFGIAAVIDPTSEVTDATLTIAGALVGTPRFMPPEHILGQPSTPASDLYSFGLTLTELLTGERVVPGGELMPTLFAHGRDEPHILPQHPHVSPELAAILSRLIAKDPGARYARADEVIADLAALGVARNPTPPPHTPRPPRDDPPAHGELTPNELDALIQGRDSWWHFLDAKSRGESLGHTVGERGPQVAFDVEDASETGLELDLDHDRMRARTRPRFQPHALANLSCSRCGALVPADLTFCVYCGGEPRYQGTPSAHLLVIEDVADPQVLSHLSELLRAANDDLDADELASALSQPPAVFFFHAFPDHAGALVDRLAEVGVDASLSSPDAPSVSLAREVQEAIFRDKKLTAGFFGILALWALVAFIPSVGVPFAMLGILATVFGTIFVQRRRYEERYTVDPARVLELLNGLGGDLPESCSRVLSSLRDDEVRDLLTGCLMEYYAIWRHLSSAPPHVTPILGELESSLDDLLSEVLDASARYAELHTYLADHPRSRLERRVSELAEKARAAQDEPSRQALVRELGQRRKQLATTERIESILPRVRERLEAMRATMESLRARVVAVTSLDHQLDALDGDSLEVILAELDDEVTIFEQTVAEAAEVAR
jgi:serine/threonine protein kinase